MTGMRIPRFPHPRRGRSVGVEEVVVVRAAVLEAFGRPVAVREVDDPVAGEGAAVVEVLAAGVLPYSAEVFGGRRRYPLEPPVVPGCGGVGVVRAVGPDATHVRPGDLVWCDPTVRGRDDAVDPAITLQGWSSRGDDGLALSRHWHDDTWAELVRLPLECLEPLGDLDPAKAPGWASLGVHLVPYGGLLAARLGAGETLLVSGATGNFGSSAVAVGLAMGAARVVAPGRKRAVLAELARRFGDRVVTVPLTGADDAAAMRDAAGPVDIVIDLLPPEAPTTAVRAAVEAVRPYGRVVLMGGVGMLGGDDLALPYPWLMRNGIELRGQWMYPRSAVRSLVALARAGLLDLDGESVTTFPLAEVDAAVVYAAGHGGPFERTVLLPRA